MSLDWRKKNSQTLNISRSHSRNPQPSNQSLKYVYYKTIKDLASSDTYTFINPCQQPMWTVESREASKVIITKVFFFHHPNFINISFEAS